MFKSYCQEHGYFFLCLLVALHLEKSLYVCFSSGLLWLLCKHLGWFFSPCTRRVCSFCQWLLCHVGTKEPVKTALLKDHPNPKLSSYGISSSPFHTTPSVSLTRLKTERSPSEVITQYDIHFLQSRVSAEFHGGCVSPKDTYCTFSLNDLTPL